MESPEGEPLRIPRSLAAFVIPDVKNTYMILKYKKGVTSPLRYLKIYYKKTDIRTEEAWKDKRKFMKTGRL